MPGGGERTREESIETRLSVGGGDRARSSSGEVSWYGAKFILRVGWNKTRHPLQGFDKSFRKITGKQAYEMRFFVFDSNIPWFESEDGNRGHSSAPHLASRKQTALFVTCLCLYIYIRDHIFEWQELAMFIMIPIFESSYSRQTLELLHATSHHPNLCHRSFPSTGSD